jgi:hypothetical protein
MTSVTTFFSGDRVSYYFADLGLNRTQTNWTCVNHDNKYSVDRERRLVLLSRTTALDDIRLSKSTRFLEATDGNHMISG